MVTRDKVTVNLNKRAKLILPNLLVHWSNLTVIDSAHLWSPCHFIWIKLYLRFWTWLNSHLYNTTPKCIHALTTGYSYMDQMKRDRKSWEDIRIQVGTIGMVKTLFCFETFGEWLVLHVCHLFSKVACMSSFYKHIVWVKKTIVNISRAELQHSNFLVSLSQALFLKSQNGF